MERNNVGLATPTNSFDKLKSILFDANRLGLFSDNPLDGVIAPRYDPERTVIPSVEQLRETGFWMGSGAPSASPAIP